ncbi:MAG: hypothetical protein C0500_01880 [Sphingobium sp.]|nr:hypothetical protein [Sphingobium sp.]
MVAAMLALLMPLQVAGPTVRALRPRAPATAQITTVQRRNQMMADARALIVRADAMRVGYAPAAGAPSRDEIDRAIADTKAELDSMSKMSEMDMLALQRAMDRMSKMMATLSNLMKKASETSSSITQNLK